MSETAPPPETKAAERKARLAARLRENLKKRKAQVRARDATGTSIAPAEAPAAKMPNPKP